VPPDNQHSLRELLAGDVVAAARGLVGCLLVHGDRSAVIVETEAYHQREEACHGYRPGTDRRRRLARAPGRAYVYRSYGIHQMLNVVAEPEGVAAAVLLRAALPLTGEIEMRAARRGLSDPLSWCSGPGKLAEAFAIGPEHDGLDLLAGHALRLEPAPEPLAHTLVVSGPRIGISRAAELPWRFALAGNAHVSRPRPAGWRTAGAVR